MATGSGLSGRDMFTRSYLTGLYRYELGPPPLPPGIDVGAPAIDRAATAPSGYTFIAIENPANQAGNLEKIAVYFNTACSGLKVGIFIKVNGTTFTTRSWVNIGNAPVGYSEHDVNLAIEPGDFIGYYCTSGKLERDNTGEGYWYLNSDKIPCTNRSFSYGGSRTLSLEGW